MSPVVAVVAVVVAASVPVGSMWRKGGPEESHCMRSMARAAPHAPHAAHIVHAAHAAAGGGGNGGDGGGCSGGGGVCCCCCSCSCSCGCCRSSAFSSSFCRSPLHVSTFHLRTVVSMFGRLCHLFVHALSSLQVANAQCMTLRSPGSQQEKTSERKRTRLAAGKNCRAAGKSCFRSGKKRQQKMPLRSGKNSKQQKKHFAALKKHLCSRKNAFWRQREKNQPRREKTRPRQEKKRPRQEKKQQQRKPSFATQKVAATEKIHFRNWKKQQDLIIETLRSDDCIS